MKKKPKVFLWTECWHAFQNSFPPSSEAFSMSITIFEDKASKKISLNDHKSDGLISLSNQMVSSLDMLHARVHALKEDTWECGSWPSVSQENNSHQWRMCCNFDHARCGASWILRKRVSAVGVTTAQWCSLGWLVLVVYLATSGIG